MRLACAAAEVMPDIVPPDLCHCFYTVKEECFPLRTVWLQVWRRRKRREENESEDRKGVFKTRAS